MVNNGCVNGVYLEFDRSGGPVFGYLGKVVLAVVAVATACLHQAAGGQTVCVISGRHSDAAVALLHYDSQEHSSVDAVGRSDTGDGDTDAVHWNTLCQLHPFS